MELFWPHTQGHELPLITTFGVILSIEYNLERFIQMAASKQYNLRADEMNAHNYLSVCDNLNHHAFRHHAFRSVMLIEFRTSVRK